MLLQEFAIEVVKCWLLSLEGLGSLHGLKVAENDASSELLSIKTGVEHLGVGGCTTKSLMVNTDESSSDKISACTDCTWLITAAVVTSAAVTFKLLDGVACSTLDCFENGPPQSNSVN